MEAQDLLAQQNIFSLTQEQAERVDVLKAEIAQGVLTGDIIGELLLKAVEACCKKRMARLRNELRRYTAGVRPAGRRRTSSCIA